ncbi:olfactory receptor 13C4-like [Spea bombifrons]|uniref:olfactory receptor 13C4-like n=1 Tax=Spea bombifrons TaxID=233779 RepID=UPI00234AA09E|nr:olfactory receptor 13C4-like [Spea bombifrons]
MQSVNRSAVTEFILLGLSTDGGVQVLLFQLFLGIYAATLAGNTLLVVAVSFDSRLHNSMYFFLIHLSFINVCGSSVTVPKMLVNFLSEKKSISFTGCVAQIFFNLLLGESECILLVLMAYDRFVAVCNPLRYNMVLNKLVCIRMVTATWMVSCITSSVDVFFICRLTFCDANVINHFFCEVPSLSRLSCSDTSVIDGLRFVGSFVLLLVPLLLILFSYFKIIVSITRIKFGRYKTFSTCLSHLVVVTMYYGTAMFMYTRPRLSIADSKDKMVSMFYTVITPMLNPLIYSLRNKDVQQAMKRLGR